MTPEDEFGKIPKGGAPRFQGGGGSLQFRTLEEKRRQEQQNYTSADESVIAPQPQDDWQPVGKAEEKDDWQPVGGPEPLPRAFMDRVRAGDLAEKDQALDDVHDPWGRPGPLFQTDPFELAAERVRRRYSTRALDPASLAASSGKVGWGMLLGGMVQGLATLPKRAIEEAGELQRTGEYGKPGEMPTGLEGALLTFGTGTKFGRVVRDPVTGIETPQTIGTVPTDADFKTAAARLGPRLQEIEENLRGLWQDEGIHPAEAVHDAQNDAFKMELLTLPFEHPADRSGLPPVQNSPVPTGTPRTELARTGDPYIDRVLFSPITKRNIDNPIIDATHDVPYAGGGSVPLEDPTMFIDRHFPRSMEIDGVRFDPADPFTIHENVEQHVMDQLMKGGMAPNTAYEIAHWEYAEVAENAWYRAHGIDPEKAAEAYKPFFKTIQPEKLENPPPNLYKDPYPSQNVRAAANDELVEAKPTAADIKKAKAILDAQEKPGEMAGEPLQPVGAAVSPPPSLSQQPPPSPGRLSTAFHDAASKLFDIGRDIQMKLTPMATGTRDSMALAKDFANSLRRNRWEWSRYDTDLEKRFTPEQRERMWNAADEESVARQLGEPREQRPGCADFPLP